MQDRLCIVPSNDRDGFTVAIVTWKSDKIVDGEDLLDIVRDVLKEWLETDEGKKAYADSMQDFNVGDLSHHLESLADMLKDLAVYDLKIVTYDMSDRVVWRYDDHLMPNPEEDD